MRKFVSILLLSSLMLWGCSNGPDTPEAKWLEHYAEQDYQNLVALYDPEAIVRIDGRVLIGKGQIEGYWRQQLEADPLILELNDRQYSYIGDLLTVTAEYSFLGPRFAEGMEVGRLTQIWHSNGVDWFIEEEVWAP